MNKTKSVSTRSEFIFRLIHFRIYLVLSLGIILSGCGVSSAGEDALKLAKWQDIAAAPIVDYNIQFEINDRTYSLESDLDFITHYYASRHEDDFLKEQTLRILQTKELASRGKAASEGLLFYNDFTPVRLDNPFYWSDEIHQDPTFQWLHQQLDMSQQFLAADYQLSGNGDSIYLDKLLQLLTSWQEDNYVNNPPSKFSWNDHGTAYRLRNFLYIYEYFVGFKKDLQCLPLLLKLIHSHCLVLSDEAFYSKFTNHGFDQSFILYWAASVFPEFVESPEFSRIGQQRVHQELQFMFTPEGVHVENSPSYHNWVLKNVEFVDELFVAYGDSRESGEITGIINDAWAYFASIIKPNGHIPLVGDSIDTDYRGNLISDRPYEGVDWAIYSASGGVSGKKPDWTDRIYPGSGYAVFRLDWLPAEQFDQSPFLFFKSSYLGRYHRHDDDLSFTLFAFGEDWIIDSGRLSYDEKDPMRIYMRSINAHNLCIPLGDFPVSRDMKIVSPGTGIIDYEQGDKRLSVTARSSMFTGAKVQRKIVYTKPFEYSITDMLDIENGGARLEGVKLLFHIPKDKKISVETSRVRISSKKGSELDIELKDKPASIRIVSGQLTPEIQGWRSLIHGVYEESQCLEILYLELPGNNALNTRLRLIPAE